MKNKNWKHGYKVVYALDARTKTSSNAPTACGTVYHVNKESHRRPFCGPLAVFKTKKDAIRFFKDCYMTLNSGFCIFKCKYIPTKLKTKSLWGRQKDGTLIPFEQNSVPKGTAFADTVMITEEVYRV